MTKEQAKETTKKTVAKKTVTKKTVAKKTVTKKVTAKALTPAETHVEEILTPNAVGIDLKTDGTYIYSTGRRKTAIANVRVFTGAQKNELNKKSIQDYFGSEIYVNTALEPLKVSGILSTSYIKASVNGGGKVAQAEAVSHAIAKALATISDDVKKIMKKHGFMTRDSRQKERKKPGLHGARRSPQWAKR